MLTGVVFFGLVSSACAAKVPQWTAAEPDPTLPLGGYEMVDDVEHVAVYEGNYEAGTYNHAAMIDYHKGTFFLAWKNGNESEDKAGQRILYSQSLDGKTWTKTDGTNILFPDMTTSKRAAAMFVGPPVHLNGRLYVGASPGTPTGAADGAQFCLWPDPLNLPDSEGGKRNCGPPQYKQDKDTLLMREVLPGLHLLGPIFWASNSVPKNWATASAALGFKTLDEMDAQTQADVALLSPEMAKPPCPTLEDGSLKCEACSGGCQLYDSIPFHVSNERTHYVLPNASNSDVLLYRLDGEVIYASMREGTTDQKAWSTPVATTLPNDESNLNAGILPGGSVYLVNNPVFRAKNKTLGSQVGTLRYRDPVTVAVSRDGYDFSFVKAVMSCKMFPSNISKCAPRYAGGGKNPGPSYPQGLAVVSPAPAEHQGFYVVATNNKEDVWVAKVPYASILPSDDSVSVTSTTTPAPVFDGILRTVDVSGRVDAYLKPPPCPAGVKECTNSSNHCASLEILPDGSLALAWFTGYVEGWTNTGLAISRLPKLGKAWMTADVITRTDGWSTQNPVLFYDTGTMTVFHTRQPSKSKVSSLRSDPVPNQESEGRMWVMTSAVSGSASPWAWSEPEPLDGKNGTWGRNSIIKRLDGSWLVPVYNESQKTLGHQYETSMLFHKPSGSSLLPFNDNWGTIPFNNSSYLVQPSVVRLKAGEPHLRVYFRDRRAEWIYTSVSLDDGATWSEAVKTNLPNNNAGIHATVLSSGAVAVVYNNMAGQTKHNLRNHLAVSISDDGGATFSVTRVLEDHDAFAAPSASVNGLGPTSCNCYSYPVIVQTADGSIHIAFTWQRRTIKYTRVDEAWVRSSGATTVTLLV